MKRSDVLAHLPPDGITLRCGAGICHACPGCRCACHDPQQPLPFEEVQR